MKRIGVRADGLALTIVASSLACAFFFVALVLPAPAWAADRVCGYAYLEKGAGDAGGYTLVIQNKARKGGTNYLDLGPIRSQAAGLYRLPWKTPVDYRDKIKRVKVDKSEGLVSPTSTNGWFADLVNVESFDLAGLDMSRATSASSMFSGCESLIELNLSNLNTSKMEDLSSMFYGCWSLTKLKLSGLNTSKVTNMSNMFYACESLRSLDLSSWNTACVRDMSSMFYDCPSLQSLNLKGFATSKVKDMSNMFYGCSSLASLDVAHFDTSKATNMCAMFSDCSLLSSLDVARFDTSKATSMSAMFCNCASLKSLNVTRFKTASVRDMSDMFSGCKKLVSLNVSSFETSKVSNMNSMFGGCKSLRSLNLSGFETARVTTMSWMFDGCASLRLLNLSGLDLSKLKEAADMFNGCKSLTSVILANTLLPAKNSVDLFGVLGDCNLKRLTIGPRVASADVLESMFSISSIWIAKGEPSQSFTSASALFDYLSNSDAAVVLEAGKSRSGVFAYLELKSGTLVLCPHQKALGKGERRLGFVTENGSVPWSSASVKRVRIEKGVRPTSTVDWFSGCSKLKSVVGLENLDTSNVTDMSGMFSGCASLRSIDLHGLNVKNVENMSYLFYGCKSLRSLDLTALSTPHVKDLSGMFYGCKSLAALHLKGFKTANAKSMKQMFGRCSSLESIDLSGFRTAKVETMTEMFKGCSSLKTIDLSSFDTAKVSDLSLMFYGCTSLRSIDLRNFHAESAELMNEMFRGCKALVSLKAGKTDIPHVQDMRELFKGCTDLASVDLGGWRVTAASGEVAMTDMFAQCSALEHIALFRVSGAEANEGDGLFTGCTNLKTVRVLKGTRWVPRLTRGMWKASEEGADASSGAGQEYRFDHIPVGVGATYHKVSEVPYYFARLTARGELSIAAEPFAPEEGDVLYQLPDAGCATAADVPWNSRANEVKSVRVEQDVAPQSTAHWFEGCTALTAVDVSGLNTADVTDFSRMFYRCSSLRELDLSGFDTRSAKSMRRMFHHCLSLDKVVLGEGFTFRGAAWERLAGSELPMGAWQPEDGDPLHAYSSDSLPNRTAATYRKVDVTEGLVVESLRGDTKDCTREYKIETQLVSDGAGGYVAENTYIVGKKYASNTFVIGDSAGASSTTVLDSSTVSAQSVKSVRGGSSGVHRIVLGRRVEQVGECAFETCPEVDSLEVRSDKLTTKESLYMSLTDSHVSLVEISPEYVSSALQRRQVADAFMEWSMPMLDATITCGEDASNNGYATDQPTAAENAEQGEGAGGAEADAGAAFAENGEGAAEAAEQGAQAQGSQQSRDSQSASSQASQSQSSSEDESQGKSQSSSARQDRSQAAEQQGRNSSNVQAQQAGSEQADEQPADSQGGFIWAIAGAVVLVAACAAAVVWRRTRSASSNEE